MIASAKNRCQKLNDHKLQFSNENLFSSQKNFIIGRPLHTIGLLSFGRCQSLMVVPRRYAGPVAIMQIHIFQSAGEAVLELYANDGILGDWQLNKDRFRFELSL